MAFKVHYAVMNFTDGIIEHGAGVAYEVKWHAIFYLWDDVTETGKYEYHYFGTPMPEPLPLLDRYPGMVGIQHPASPFPQLLKNLPDGNWGLYAVAFDAEINVLNI